MKTKAERIVAVLLERGCVEMPSTARKYRKFRCPAKATLGCDHESFYWIGKMGALRVGPTITDSHSLTDSPMVKKWLVAGV